MNEHDFEKRLREHSLRPLPGHWRSEILAAAQVAHPARQSLLSHLTLRTSHLLWPSSYAWGGLAAIWLFIVLVNLPSADGQVEVAKTTPAPAPQVIAQVREQRRLMAELVGPSATPPPIDRPRHHPLQPRSDRRTRISAV